MLRRLQPHLTLRISVGSNIDEETSPWVLIKKRFKTRHTLNSKFLFSGSSSESRKKEGGGNPFSVNAFNRLQATARVDVPENGTVSLSGRLTRQAPLRRAACGVCVSCARAGVGVGVGVGGLCGVRGSRAAPAPAAGAVAAGGAAVAPAAVASSLGCAVAASNVSSPAEPSRLPHDFALHLAVQVRGWTRRIC